MIVDLTDRQWLWAAAGFYLAGFALGTWSLWRGGKPSGTKTNLLIAAGYALQFAGLAVRGKTVGGCPLGNIFEIFQFTAWSAITLYFAIGVTFRSSVLGYFTACLAAALTFVSLAIPGWDAVHRTKIFGGNPWIEMHAAIALFSYGVFSLLALTSIMFLARNFSLKSKRIGGWFTFLPSLLDLDHIGVRLLTAGNVLLAASLAVGSVYWVRDTASADLPKILVTVGVWVAYAVALGLRHGGVLLSNRFAWTCLALFVCALLSLPLVDASRHPTAKPAAGKEVRP